VKMLTINLPQRVLSRVRASPQWICRGIACVALIAAASKADTPGMPQSEWSGLLRARLPSLICRDHWYVRQCFSISAEECDSAIKSDLTGCLQEFGTRIPPIITSKEDSAEWGKTIAQCIGARFEHTMKRHKKSSAQCAAGSW
jgi:hypothetical protein